MDASGMRAYPDERDLLERDDEIAALCGLLRDTATRGGCVVLIRGEAGIGKSALASRFLAEIVDEAHVLVGECDDLSTPQPFGPIWDVAREEPDLAPLLAAGDRRGIMTQLLDVLSRALRPTVLLFEDMQWADEATLDVTRFLGRRLRRANGLLLLTYRDGEVDAYHPLREVIGALPPGNLLRIRLRPLSERAITSMIDDTGLDAASVLQQTGGNPLFVTEIIAAGKGAVPASVRDSVLARAMKLSPGARRLLNLVSVFPRRAELTVIEAIPGTTAGQITECEQGGFLHVSNGTISFRHEVARRAVESALGAAETRRLNRLVLTVIIGRADPSRIVHHAKQAGDVGTIVEYAPEAARAAMAIPSYREALEHFRTLEPFMDRLTQPDRAALLESMARAEYYLNDRRASDTLARAVDLRRAVGSDRDLASALTFAVRVFEMSGRPEEAEASAAEAVALLEPYSPSPELALAIGRRAWLLQMRGDRRQSVEQADRAIRVGTEVDAEKAIIQSLNIKGCELCSRGEGAGFELLQEARRRAERIGIPFEETRALSNMSEWAGALLDLERAADLAQRARDTAARYEIPAAEAYAQVQLGAVLLDHGEWTAAEDAVTGVIGWFPNVEVVAAWILGTLQARRGREQAGASLAQSWSLATSSNEIQNLVAAATAYAEHMWLTEDVDHALAEQFLEVLEASADARVTRPAGRLAFWLWKLGSISSAPAWITEPYRLVIEGDSAAAARIWEEKGFPYEHAMALAHGGIEDQTTAVRMLEDLGAPATAGRVRRMLAGRGVRIPRGKSKSTLRHGAGLTARQAEVLDLLDEGLTSPEIADRLFISRRTAEHHVSAILTKLDVADRKAAVLAARDLGILPPR